LSPKRREKLILSRLNLVTFLATPFKDAAQSVGLSWSDVLQEGRLGLIRAVDEFVPRAHRVDFSSYAQFWIRAFIQRAIGREWSHTAGRADLGPEHLAVEPRDADDDDESSDAVWGMLGQVAPFDADVVIRLVGLDGLGRRNRHKVAAELGATVYAVRRAWTRFRLAFRDSNGVDFDEGRTGPPRLPALILLFPVVSFTPNAACAHHGPIARGSVLCCASCHKSGLDHLAVMQPDPRTDPKPDPKPKAESTVAPARETRAQRRGRLFAGRPGHPKELRA